MTDEIEKRIGECGEAIFDFHYGIHEAQSYIREGKWDDAKRMVDSWVHGSLGKMATVCKVDIVKALEHVSMSRSAIDRRDNMLAINRLNASIGEMLWQFSKKKLGR